MINKWLNFKQILAGQCLFCLTNQHESRSICPACQNDMRPAHKHHAMPFNPAIPKPYIDQALAVYSYTYPADALIKRLKYQGEIRLARHIADDIAEMVRQTDHAAADLLVPVPLHPVRKMLRGFNQAALIARHLSHALDIPLNERLVYRTRNTRPQSALSTQEKWRNVNHAFTCRGDGNKAVVAIIDDIITTGSTAQAMACLLKKQGFEKVVIWAWARTESSLRYQGAQRSGHSIQ